MSKQIVEGVIENVYVKELDAPDDYGNQYAITVKIGGNLYGMGRKKKPSANVKYNGNWHQISEGDVVEAVCEVVERNGRTYNNIKASEVTVKQVGGGSSGGSAGNNLGSGGGTSNRGGAAVSTNDDRQVTIMRQSAMGYAAQVVAGTLTSKSDLDQAAADVVRLANEYFLPFAQYGVTEDETRKAEEQELKYQQASQAEDDNGEFNDEIPF